MNSQFFDPIAVGGALGVLALLIYLLIFRQVRYGALRHFIFGARIDQPVLEILGESRGPMHFGLNVYALTRKSGGTLVGIEARMKTLGVYRTIPVTLSIADAQRLAVVLTEVAHAGQAT